MRLERQPVLQMAKELRAELNSKTAINGAGYHPASEAKPLTAEQLSIIDSFKHPWQQNITALLFEARKPGKSVPIKKLVEIYESIANNHKTSIDYEDDHEPAQKRVRDFISRVVRPEFEKVGLHVVNERKPGKGGGESFYSTKTTEELPSTQELAQTLTIKQVSELTGYSLTSIRLIVKKDPTITVHHSSNRKGWQKILLSQADVDKKIMPIVKAGRAKEDQKGSKSNGLTNKSPESNNDYYASGEYSQRSILGKTEEEQRQDLGLNVTAMILSCIVRDCMDEVDTDPREVLANFLPMANPLSKMNPKRVIGKIPPAKFILEELRKNLTIFWPINSISQKDSVREKKMVRYCLEIKQKEVGKEDILEIVSEHFSVPDKITSSPAPESQEVVSRF